ncbi:MAG: hypothetical protein HPY69_15750 [Armatimonadetes bacterium]|nr:hypothetical protein [Armatimonadota bacterium]
MPMGGKSTDWDYPTLEELARSDRKPVDLSRRVDFPRLILVQGLYSNRTFRCAIADGAHRALALVRTGAQELEAYWGAARV